MGTNTKTRKPTPHQIAQLWLIYRAGGVVASSDWTTGSGRYVSQLATPLHCDRADNDSPVGLRLDIARMRGDVKRAAQRLAKARPAVRSVVYIDNLRAARRTLRAAGLLDGGAADRFGEVARWWARRPACREA